VEPLLELHYNCSLLALPTKIRLGWKRMEVVNTLAYYDTATLTVVKRFMVQVTRTNKYSYTGLILFAILPLPGPVS
jgi:hypothetical protein